MSWIGARWGDGLRFARWVLDRVNLRAWYLRFVGFVAVWYGLAYTPWLEPRNVAWPIEQLARVVPGGLLFLAIVWMLGGAAAIFASFTKNRWPPLDFLSVVLIGSMWIGWGTAYFASFFYYLAHPDLMLGERRDWFVGPLYIGVGGVLAFVALLVADLDRAVAEAERREAEERKRTQDAFAVLIGLGWNPADPQGARRVDP